MIAKMNDIAKSIEILRNHKDILDKKTIAKTYKHVGASAKSSVYFPTNKALIKLGDDAAAIPEADGSYLLLAAEGIVTHFLDNDPWFAGYSAVMVNISDICAMGGLPIAVTDTLYAYNAEDSAKIWEGMLAASKAYGVPIVGGHTCYRSSEKGLSVSILGKATKNILSSFKAKKGETLLLAIDQNGEYYKEYPFWNASTNTNPAILQERVQLPYQIANNNWSSVAKDVSMGGIIGTLLMLLNTSEVGAEINLEDITKPKKVQWEKWLSSFPSYGYVFTCSSENVKNIQSLFFSHGIKCDQIGNIISKKELIINHKGIKIKF